MAITLLQTDAARVSPTDDARLYQLLASDAEGIVEGCQITHRGGRVLHITSGWGIAQGRCFVVTDQDITVTAPVSGTRRGRLIVRLQPSQVPAASLATVMGSPLPQLVQNRINYGGQTYELELATYDIGETALSGLRTTVRTIRSPGSAIYTATFRLGSWSHSGNTWTQVADCTGMQAAYDTEPPFVLLPGQSKEDDDLLRDAMNQMAEGHLETLDGQLKATLWAEPPTCDIEIHLRRAVI